MRIRHIKYFIIVFAGLFFFGGRPIEFGNENSFFHGFVIPNPVIRIGLGTGLGDIMVHSSSGMKVYEVGAGYELLGDDVEEARIKGEEEQLTEKFVLLMAQTKDRKEAEQIAAGLRDKTGLNVSVEEARESGLGGVFQVKIGDYLTRGDALSAISGLNAKGLEGHLGPAGGHLPGGESAPAGSSSGTDCVRWAGIPSSISSRATPKASFLTTAAGTGGSSSSGAVPGAPSSSMSSISRIISKGSSRASFLPTSSARSRPSRPRRWPPGPTRSRILGQYRALGYDLSDTPASQVYGGLDAERPLSTRAVDETRGEVIRYKGELINALYMSTCGGMTEDVENVFSGKPVAYLKSTECGIEKRPEWTVERRSDPSLRSSRPAGTSRRSSQPLWGGMSFRSRPKPPIFRLRARFPRRWNGPGTPSGWPGKADLAYAPGPGPLDFPSLAGLLVAAFDWRGHVENLLLPSEVNFILRDLPGVRPQDRKNLAYCVQMGLFPFLPAGPQGAGRTPTRAEVAYALSRILAGRADPFHEGTFRSASAGALELPESDGPRTLKASPHMFLVRSLDGTRSSAARLHLLGGEKVRWLETDGEVRLLEVSYRLGVQRPRPLLPVQPLGGPEVARGPRERGQSALPRRPADRYRRPP